MYLAHSSGVKAGSISPVARQGEVAIIDPLQQPDTVFSGNRLRSVTAHLARRDAARLAQPAYPAHRRADANPELLGSVIAGQRRSSETSRMLPAMPRPRQPRR
jgi:hypothetical protein